MNISTVQTTLALAFSVALAIFFISSQNAEVKSTTLVTPMVGPQPIELGKVKWLRNMEQAQALAKKEGKPILLLFQEVPGCATCQRYGNGALSHPLIVEAIETEFVPLAIFNNKRGADAQVLEYFGEPSWNNPVVRIVSEKKRDIVPRLGSDYSPYGLVNSMLLALNGVNRVAPRYLQILSEEMQAELVGTETAILSMYCFWTGEKELAQVPGVVSTEAGWMDGREVVQVEYNPLVTDYEGLVKQAQRSSCAHHVFTEDEKQAKTAASVVGKSSTSSAGKYRTDKEPKYYLSHTVYQYVPMTPLQAAKANSMVGRSELPTTVLSPRQNALADFIAEHQDLDWENAIGVDLEEAWSRVEGVRESRE